MIGGTMDRLLELKEILKDDPIPVRLIEEMVYLEEQLDKYRKMEKIKVHPEDPTKQKVLPAAKIYKDYLQQYVNVVKALEKVVGEETAEADSPLRRWMNEHLDAG